MNLKTSHDLQISSAMREDSTCCPLYRRDNSRRTLWNIQSGPHLALPSRGSLHSCSLRGVCKRQRASFMHLLSLSLSHTHTHTAILPRDLHGKGSFTRARYSPQNFLIWTPLGLERSTERTFFCSFSGTAAPTPFDIFAGFTVHVHVHIHARIIIRTYVHVKHVWAWLAYSSWCTPCCSWQTSQGDGKCTLPPPNTAL